MRNLSAAYVPSQSVTEPQKYILSLSW